MNTLQAKSPPPDPAASRPGPMWAHALAGLALVCALFALPLLFISAGAEHAALADGAAILAAALALAAILFGHLAEWHIKRVSGKRSPSALVALVAGYVAIVLCGPIA